MGGYEYKVKESVNDFKRKLTPTAPCQQGEPTD